MTPAAKAAQRTDAPRAAASVKRRQAILDAALDSFVAKGYAQTTIADVRERSGASIGSIYHHFGSKEEIAAAVYVDGLAGYQGELVRVLARNRDAEAGVKAVVRHHLRWVSRYPDLARYMRGSRPAEVVLASEGPLRELNRGFFAEVGEWLEHQHEAGRLRRLPTDLLYAILIGPSQEFSRHWLARRTKTSLTRASSELAEAAWQALRTPGTPGRRR